jgi:hypothetical protein
MNPESSAPSGRTVTVYSRREGKTQNIPVSTHLVLQRLYTALKDGLKMSPVTEWWSSLAPLNLEQRAFVRREVARLAGMKPEEQAAELLAIAAEGQLR